MYVRGDVPPAAVRVTVAVPPVQDTAELTAAEPVSNGGWGTSRVPVTGPQFPASVMLQGYVPAGIPANTPVVLVTLLKVYDNGAVPPVAVIVTVAVPPLQIISEVTIAEPCRSTGSFTSMEPVAGVHPLASFILHK